MEIAKYVGIINDQLVNIWKGGTTLSPFSPIANGDTMRALAANPAHVPREIPIMKIKRCSKTNTPDIWMDIFLWCKTLRVWL